LSVCSALFLLKKNRRFGSFPPQGYQEPYRKLLSASYGVALCQPQIAPDRMQRLFDKLDCNSSAIVVAVDTLSCTHHTCDIPLANFFSFGLQ